MAKNAVAVQDQVNGWLEANRDKLVQAMPDNVKPDQLIRDAYLCISRNEHLQKCDPLSLYMGVVQGATLGLSFAPALSEAHLVPYGNKIQFQIDYRGLVKLVRQATGGDIDAHCAHKNDKFNYELGICPKLVHVPAMSDRGEITHAYAIYKGPNFDASRMVDFKVEVMEKKDIDLIRSKAKAKGAMAWSDFYSEMARKTVVRRLTKMLPKSQELAKAVELDNQFAMGDDQTIDITGMEIPNQNTHVANQTQAQAQELVNKYKEDKSEKAKDFFFNGTNDNGDATV